MKLHPTFISHTAATTGTHAYGWFSSIAASEWTTTAVWGSLNADDFTIAWNATAVWGTCAAQSPAAAMHACFPPSEVGHLLDRNEVRRASYLF